MKKKFNIGDNWMGWHGNGIIIVHITQISKYHVNNGQYSKQQLSRYFNQF